MDYFSHERRKKNHILKLICWWSHQTSNLFGGLQKTPGSLALWPRYFLPHFVMNHDQVCACVCVCVCMFVREREIVTVKGQFGWAVLPRYVVKHMCFCEIVLRWGQGGLACCGSWGRKESDTTERLNWTELKFKLVGLNKGDWFP